MDQLIAHLSQPCDDLTRTLQAVCVVTPPVTFAPPPAVAGGSSSSSCVLLPPLLPVCLEPCHHILGVVQRGSDVIALP